MKGKWKIPSLIMAAILCIAVFTGCGTQEDSSSTLNGQTVSEAVNTTKQIDTMVIGTTMKIPSISRETYNFDVLSGTLTHMALVKQDENGEIKPFMAETFETKDNKKWTFQLRKGLTWHDGEAVTAQDVKFTAELQNTFPNYTIHVVDDQTVEFISEIENARLPIDLVTFRILPEHIFKDVTDLEAFTDPKSAIGNGPYEFVKFDESAGTLEFKAYENYIDGKPNVDKIIVKLYANTDTLYMALEKGEIDIVYFYANGIDANEAKKLESNKDITLQVIPDTGLTLMYFNNQAEPVNNIDIRRGIAYAIDYEQMAKLFGTEYATTGNFGIIPKGSFGYIDTEKLTRDIEKSKQYLEQAGAKDANQDGILEYNGKDLELELLVRTDKPTYARMAELLTSNLKEVGIKVVQKSVDTAQFRTISEQERGHVTMLTRATPWGMVMKQGAGVPYMDSRSKTGMANIDDPAFWALADKMGTSDSNDYTSLVADVQRYYAENIPAIPMYWDQFIQAYNSDFHNFTVDGTFGLLNMDTWYSITKEVTE
ncbi:MAG: ABC transporter substrate-binding protein [Acutalibacteraceae bacterium]|nr:ABC transporter substrate-binding protein [Acutalibacteraceae bacterium]